METIIKWLAEYSAPTVVLLIFGAVLLFLVKRIAEKTIAQQFDRYSKKISLTLERVSKFKEHVLLESYKTVVEIESILVNIKLNLARAVKDNEPSDFIQGGEIPTLSDIAHRIRRERYLLPEKTYSILVSQKGILFDMLTAFNKLDSDLLADLDETFNKQEDLLQDEIIKIFGLNKIYEGIAA